MTQEALKGLSDNDLSQVMTWAQAEIASRWAQRKQDAIAKIREIAAGIGVTVSIEGTRGRRPKPQPVAETSRAARRDKAAFPSEKR